MSETQKKFTPDQIREFEDKYNIGVNNHEAMVELFMRQQEQIEEIAEHTRLPDFMDKEGQCFMGGRLIDKWNNQ